LDSGDDETRHDRDGDRRMQDVDSEHGMPSLQSVLYQNIPRHQTPKPSNGEVSILLFLDILSANVLEFSSTVYACPNS